MGLQQQLTLFLHHNQLKLLNHNNMNQEERREYCAAITTMLLVGAVSLICIVALITVLVNG